MLRRSILVASCLMAGTLSGHALSQAGGGTCPSGAQVATQNCKFFVHFSSESQGPLDRRIVDALKVKDASQTRSIGLIVAIDQYPNIPNANLTAAAKDAERLQRFLIDDQHFDEVIVLRNGDATVDNIKYFLDGYLYHRAADFPGKARLLIAYSGHGESGGADGEGRAAFILSNAKDLTGTDGIYRMQDLAKSVELLAAKYFHVLTLVNACYGGSFFMNGRPGGNPDAFARSGSYAITAGADDQVVFSLDPSKGSLFFDLLIEGVKTGTADPLYWEIFRTVSEKGEVVDAKGVTRTLALLNFLTSSYMRVARARAHVDPTFSLSEPWIGPAQSGVARGGFFFLSERGKQTMASLVGDYGKDPSATPVVASVPERPQVHISPKDELPHVGGAAGANVSSGGPAVAKSSANTGATPEATTTSPRPAVAAIATPAGPVSSIPGHPEIKIFKAPDIYPVSGFDVSSEEGIIDWNKVVVSTDPPRFMYARLAGWRGIDRTFPERWAALRKRNIDRGAYLKYDFCLSVGAQFKRLAALLPRDAEALPPAIELVSPVGIDEHQLGCLRQSGMPKAQDNILAVAKMIESHYGKTPLMYGNRYNLSQFLDKRANHYMLWLGSYGASGVKLQGTNPWTIWQYSGTEIVPGLGTKVTANVFFGTEEQYALFKKGRGNVALDAVRQ